MQTLSPQDLNQLREALGIVTSARNQELLAFWTGLGIVTSCGAAGGVVSAVAMLVEGGLDDRQTYAAARGLPIPVFIVGRAVVGIGGAVAVLFAVLSMGRYATEPTSIDLLLLAALSFVAGSIGHRLLPLVAAQVEKQIIELRHKTEKAESKADLANQQVAEVREGLDLERTVVDARAVVNMKDDAPGLVARTKEALEKLLPQNPRHRSLNLVLGRLLMRKMHSLEGAIKVLDDFIAAVSIHPEQRVDHADAWFNQACYYSLAMAQTTDPDKRMHYQNLAIAALRQSVQILPTNLQDAMGDDDLEALRHTTAFQSLVDDVVGALAGAALTPSPASTSLPTNRT